MLFPIVLGKKFKLVESVDKIRAHSVSAAHRQLLFISYFFLAAFALHVTAYYSKTESYFCKLKLCLPLCKLKVSERCDSEN